MLAMNFDATALINWSPFFVWSHVTQQGKCAGFRTVRAVVGQIGVNGALNVPINRFGRVHQGAK